MRKQLVSSIILSILLPGLAAAADQLRFRDAAQTQPFFIPAAELQAARPDPRIPAGMLAKIRQTLHQVAEQGGGNPPCRHAPESGVPGNAGAGAKSLLDRARTGEGLLLGEVTGLTPGWSLDSHYAATLVHVKLREVFGSAPRSLRPGDEVTYLQDAGVAVIQGVAYCTVDDPFYAARVGDLIVLPASLDPSNDRHIDVSSHNFYPVVAGYAVPQASAAPAGEQRVSLSALRKVAREVRQ